MSSSVPRSGRASHAAIGLLVLLSAWRWAALARADAPASASSDDEVFRYAEPAGVYPFRAALETLALLGLGTAQYFSNHDANAVDWDYDYTWRDFRTKISGSGYSFDTNRFDTNYLTHPGAGTLYYWAARSNRLSVLASFAYALSASATWEIFGEFREHASVNDLLVTPLSGLVLGETTLQLGALFDRGCATPANSVLGAVFGAFKTVHDAIDGARLLRDTDCDRFGFTRRGAHEFRLAAGEALVLSTAGSSAPPFAETQLALHSRVIALSTYGRLGSAVDTFGDGNWSELWLQGGIGARGWSDFTIGGRVVPMGLHFRELASSWGQDIGDELLAGFSLGTEYSVHRFDGGDPASSDRFFAIHVPGMAVRYVRRERMVRLEAELVTSATFSGIDALALAEYQKRHARETLTSVAQANGYNHAAGLTLAPRLRLLTGRLEAGLEADATQLWGIRGLDRFAQAHSSVPVVEVRRRAVAWTAFGPVAANVWLRSWASALQRWGSVGDARVERTELRLGLGVDAVF